jgi:hypothetical protein
MLPKLSDDFKISNQKNQCPNCGKYCLEPNQEIDNNNCYLHNLAIKRNWIKEWSIGCNCRCVDSKIKFHCYWCKLEIEKVKQ